ncbi:MAG: Transcriptional regulatory protein ZraR [Phycisphaerae bacterium]|nr:Transcriptional regulatory protein ZraR [Phycisphaerae bacterium]
MARICVIDDNELMRDSVCETLLAADYDAAGYEDATVALDDILGGGFDLVVTDLKMPRLDGVGLLSRLRESGCETAVILMTAFGTVQTAVEAMKLGAFDYLQKPFQGDELEIVVERALKHAHLLRANQAFRTGQADQARSRPMVAVGESMQAVLRQVERVAPNSATVLVTGESGTGKEMVARAIHAASPRAAAPMLAVNCAALSPALLESELFGHERGAFTGADRSRQGRFELADGGTLLLDEVGELDDRLQAKLLRVLQEREFERVGSSIARRVDVRVIATTNRPLGRWVQEGKFREDLFYRLSVLPIHIPPLRERREDVQPLAEHLLARIARREGRARLTLTPEARDLLLGYDWPGNVRELENLMERCSALADDDTIDAARVAGWLRRNAPAAEPTQSVSHAQALLGLGRNDFDAYDGALMAEMERRLIFAALKENGGHRARTAEALGIGLRTLGLKLKRYREQGLLEPVGGRDLVGAVSQ